MLFLEGTEPASVYDDAFDEGFGLTASSIAEPSTLIGLIEGASRVNSDLLVQMSNGTCTFAGNGDPIPGIKVMGMFIVLIATQYEAGVFRF